MISEIKITNYLDYDEAVLWYGKPIVKDKIFLIRIKGFLVNVFAVFVILVVLLGFLYAFVRYKYDPIVFKVLLVLCIAVDVYWAVRIFKEPGKAIGEVTYYITDKRIIRLIDAKKTAFNAQNIIDTIYIEELEGKKGSKTLVFHKVRGEYYREKAGAVTFRELKAAGMFSQMVFRNIDDYMDVINIVKEQKKIQESGDIELVN